jgi:hypothetical protein
MRDGKLSFLLATPVACAAIILLAAAAPDDGSIAPLSPAASDEAPGIAAKTVTATNAGYQAAPVPNPDVNAPPDTTKPDTTIGPKFIRQNSLFQGDGYSYASSEQGTLDGRRVGAAGLGVNVPLSDEK